MANSVRAVAWTGLACVMASSCSSESQPESVQRTTEPIVGAPAWFERQKLAPVGAANGAQFGAALAMSGDTAIIGAAFDQGIGPATGAAYVMVRDADGNWTQQQKLSAPDGMAGDRFGASVAISGERVLIGAPGADQDGADSGAAYFFTRQAGSWSLETKLPPSTTIADGVGPPVAGDHFGFSVSLDGGQAWISAPDHTVADQLDPQPSPIFEYAASSGGWATTTTIHDSVYYRKRRFVAVSSNTVATCDDPTNFSSATIQLNLSYRTPPPPYDGFINLSATSCMALAVSETYTAVTDQYAGVLLVQQRTLDGKMGIFNQTRLIPFNTSPVDGFGSALAVSEDTMLASNAIETVFVYAGSGANWKETQRFNATDGLAGDGFGSALAISGTTALVGAAARSENGVQSGVVYVEEFGEGFENGKACNVGGQCKSGTCVEGVCCDSACDNECRSCLAANTGKAQGTCANVLPGTDPHDVCAVGPASGCKDPGVCDGFAACQSFYAIGTVCGDGSCADATHVFANAQCNGSGSCLGANAQPCLAGYQCLAGACATSCVSDVSCDVSAGYVCLEGECRLPLSGAGGSPSASAGAAGALSTAGGDAGGDAGGTGGFVAGASGTGGIALGGEAEEAGSKAGGAAGEAGDSNLGRAPSIAGAAGGDPPNQGGVTSLADAGASRELPPSDTSTACGCRVGAGAAAPNAVSLFAYLLGCALLRRRRSRERHGWSTDPADACELGLPPVGRA